MNRSAYPLPTPLPGSPDLRRALAGVVVACSLLAGCSGDDAGDGARASTRTRVTVPTGSSLTFIVGERVSTETQHRGDKFRATLAGNVAGVDGAVALPQGTAGRWVVSEATDDNGQGEAVLAVQLESVSLDGHHYRVDARVVSSDLVEDAPDSGKKTAAKIGIGAAAGALVGRVLGGDAGDALKGAGVGAALGTAIALSSRSGSATLPKGAHITVRLKQPLNIET